MVNEKFAVEFSNFFAVLQQVAQTLTTKVQMSSCGNRMARLPNWYFDPFPTPFS
jgi:hypothetical protein